MTVPSPALRAGLERHMREVVRLSHTSATPADDAIDPATFKPVPSVGEAPVAYYEGKALVVPDTARMATPDGTAVEVNLYRVFLPVSAPLPEPGDIVEMLTVTDPALTDRTLVVDSAEASSLAAGRVVSARLLVAARPVHGG